MILSDLLQDIGRPVVYYPKLAKALGGIKQAAFICQLIYWSDKGTHEDGWIYKSHDELKEETGLSFREQATARQALRDLNVIEEYHAKLQHRLYFRVNFDALNCLWENFVSRNEEKAADTDALLVKEQKRIPAKTSEYLNTQKFAHLKRLLA